MKVITRKIDCIVELPNIQKKERIQKTSLSTQQKKEWDKRKAESDTKRIAQNIIKWQQNTKQ